MRPLVIFLILFFCVNSKNLFAQQPKMLCTQEEILKKLQQLFPKQPKEIIRHGRVWKVPDNKWLSPLFNLNLLPHWRSLPGKQLLDPHFEIKNVPNNFYTQNMGAFCKIELKMQKQIKFPLFIRMGSKDYVDGLEGKYLLRR